MCVWPVNSNARQKWEIYLFVKTMLLLLRYFRAAMRVLKVIRAYVNVDLAEMLRTHAHQISTIHTHTFCPHFLWLDRLGCQLVRG